MVEDNVIQDIISASLKHHSLAILSLQQNIPEIISLSREILVCMSNGGTVYVCGNGGSAADAQHFAAEIVGRFVSTRRALPAVALTTDTSIMSAVSNDFSFNEIFSRQVEAFCTANDILIAISTSGNSENILNALLSAKQRGCRTILLTGKDGGKAQKHSHKSVIIRSENTAAVQEMHIVILHMICGVIDNWFSDEKN